MHGNIGELDFKLDDAGLWISIRPQLASYWKPTRTELEGISGLLNMALMEMDLAEERCHCLDTSKPEPECLGCSDDVEGVGV